MNKGAVSVEKRKRKKQIVHHLCTIGKKNLDDNILCIK